MRAEQALEEIWRRRAGAFREEVMPYFRYMGQSGFPAFLSLILISSAIGYISLIRNLPADFPIVLVGTIALSLVICWSPLRTWLAAGDVVFMMPREADMGGYLRRSFRYTSIGCAILAAAVFLLYLPIYQQGSAFSDGWLLAAAAAGLKAGNVWGAWRERQMTWPGMRRLLRLFRWSLSALTLAVWLTCEIWQSAIFSVLISLVFTAIHRLPSRQRFPWERLIEEEARTRKRYYIFFGMFIDVPTLSSHTAKRPYLAWLLQLVPYSNRNTYIFLYSASFLRSEIGGIVIRLLLLGCLVIYWFGEAVSLSGWGSVIVFAIFMSVLAVQVGGLRHVHRFSVWKHVYPLPEKQREEQYIKVDRIAMLVCTALLWLFAAMPLAFSGVYAPSAAAAAGALLYIVIRPSRLRKKMLQDTDEE
ncbi:ABC transporter permease [Paenibacillus sp. sgz302251]|uniref:ABC transporter permease n=1 Tax=Paenibacillus sp. sgz302251 TaxID=3414493 RepID=UPI003C7A5E52